MKVSGFSFVRNAVKYDFPIVEAITSILPVCDEFIIAVGNSEDSTLELIKSINSEKIRIVETVWDESLREGGKVLAVETNKALDSISPDSDWAFYIQADEVFHEKDLTAIKDGMLRWKDDKRIEGLLFKHINFYGSYDYVADSRKWIKNEIRVIRNDKTIRSYNDAMSFRKNNKKLKIKKIDAVIYHYGWVKPPLIQLEKRKIFDTFWHDDKYIKNTYDNQSEFDYYEIDSLSKFTGTHPSVMLDRIKNKNWHFIFDPTKSKKLSLRLHILNYIYKKTGWLIGGFKNYKQI